jgi:hypothetical protein
VGILLFVVTFIINAIADTNPVSFSISITVAHPITNSCANSDLNFNRCVVFAGRFSG